MASYLLLNYRDPKKKKKNFANPVVDIAASSRSWAQLASWGCSLTENGAKNEDDLKKVDSLNWANKGRQLQKKKI